MKITLFGATIVLQFFVAIVSGQTKPTQPASTPWQPEKFPISYWCGPPGEFVTLERFQEIKDANFTYVFPSCGSVSPELNHKILDLCEQVGLKAFIQDPQMPLAMTGSYKARPDMDLIVKDFSKHPAFAGYFVTDEPGAGAFTGLGEVVAHLRRRDPKHPAFINLFPNYASAEQLGAKDYETYLREFVEKTKPFAISYDHYHFKQGGDGPLFFENLTAVRKVALENNLPFWNVVLCVQHFDYRNLTEPELRFEAMQTLAYGGKGLLWFTYWSPAADPNVAWQHAMINADGSRDPHYEMIKNINADVLAIGGELLRAQSEQVYLSKDALKDAPVTIAADNVTVGIFQSESKAPLALLASRDYKNPVNARVTIRGAGAEQFDAKIGKWSPLEQDISIAPGAAVLIRWKSEAPRADIDEIRENYIRSIVPTDAAMFARLQTAASNAIKTQNADGSWPGIDYADQRRTNWPLREHLNNLQSMARANHVRHDPQLVESIRKGLSWWLEHDPKNPNWWWNEIGVPQYLGETLLLTQNDLPREMVDRGVEIMKRSVWTKWTGQNLVWGVGVQIMRGCLTRDPQLIEQGFRRMYEEVRVATPDLEGIQADWSFHQHGPEFYSGGYGLDFANDVGRFIAHSWGTKFQIPDDKMKIYSSYVLDGERWMIRGETFDYSAVGREITRAGKAAVTRGWVNGPVSPKGAAYGIGNAVRMLAQLDVPRREEFASFAAELRGEDEAKPLIGNRHFWCSDYMAHRRAGYLASVRMFSTRLWNTEDTNKEGLKSHHLADGATFVYRRGDEYRDIFPVWDWGKVPGTTAEQGDLNTILPHGNHEKGKTDFVGGVSDGTYGMCAMDLERGALRAKKAWFFFDDVIVCLGAGITCTSENPVVTSINQCLAHGEDYRVMKQGAYHDSIYYGYGAGAHSAIVKQTGRWSELGAGSDEMQSKDVFTSFIDHGRRPENATYQYSIGFAPTAGDEIEVLSNTPELQAVHHKQLGIVMAAFREPGEIVGTSVDQPCLLLRRGDEVCVSNPRNQPRVVNVKVAGQSVRFDLPAGPMAGSTIVKSIR